WTLAAVTNLLGNVVRVRNHRRGDFPGTVGMFTAFYGRRFDLEGDIFSNRVKAAHLPIKIYGITIPCPNRPDKGLRTKPGRPIVLIDNMTRLRRHAAPIYGWKNSAMLAA